MKKVTSFLFISFVANFATADVVHVKNETQQTVQNSLKIRTVNMAEVYNKFYKTPDAEKSFKVVFDNVEKEKQAMIKEYETMRKSFQDLQTKLGNSDALSDSAKKDLNAKIKESADLLMKKEISINEFISSTDQRLMQTRQAALDELFKEIQTRINLFAQKEGFDMIFNSVGSNVVFSNDKYDVTSQIITFVNAGHVSSVEKNSKSEKISSKAENKTAKK